MMATHNCSDVLPRSTESVLAQTFCDFEFIIIEDGSQDATHAVLKKYADCDNRMHVLRNARNVGLAVSLNKAIGISRGQLLARMDADDICVPHRLNRQIDFLMKNPDIDVCGAGIEAMDQEGRFLEYRYRPENHEELAARIFYENPFYHSTVMARRQFFEGSGGYNPRLRRCQDYDLWLRTYRSFRFHNLQESLVRYRVKDNVSWQSVCLSALVLLRAMSRDRVLGRNWWIAFRGPVRKALERHPHSALIGILGSIYHRRKGSVGKTQ
jgi:glycosyltransferase involved in cell wall biosynthesis